MNTFRVLIPEEEVGEFVKIFSLEEDVFTRFLDGIANLSSLSSARDFKKSLEESNIPLDSELSFDVVVKILYSLEEDTGLRDEDLSKEYFKIFQKHGGTVCDSKEFENRLSHLKEKLKESFEDVLHVANLKRGLDYFLTGLDWEVLPKPVMKNSNLLGQVLVIDLRLWIEHVDASEEFPLRMTIDEDDLNLFQTFIDQARANLKSVKDAYAGIKILG